jgi:hypothetical protein
MCDASVFVRDRNNGASLGTEIKPGVMAVYFM